MVEQRESESTIATRSAVRISIFCERGVGRDASATNEAAVPTGNVGRGLSSGLVPRARASDLPEQHQDQHDHDHQHQAETTAAVITSAVERPPPKPLKPPSSAMTKMMSRMVPIDVALGASSSL